MSGTDNDEWLRSFRLRPSDFSYVGTELQRPESVLALRDGSVLASDKSAVVTRIWHDGRQARIGRGAQLANGFALNDDGLILATDLARGVILKVLAGGHTEILLDSFDGESLAALNFMIAGRTEGEFWITESTRQADFWGAISNPTPDGRIYRLTGGKLSLAADGLWFPNEVRFDTLRSVAYVVETTRRAIARAPMAVDGSLGKFERFGPEPLYRDAYPDGVTLDTDGNLWITELSRNAIVVMEPSGRIHPIFEDAKGEVLNKPTSIAFGGTDMRTAYVGSLKMPFLAVFKSPIAGQELRHWQRMTALAV